MGLDWQLQTQSTLTVASKPKRNKLRRRRRPSPIRAMTVVANGVDHLDTPMSAAASSSPTLLENGRHDEKDKTLDEAQAQVISSLRTQITDLITQVSQLNGKLVKSYDRVSDLEDELHIASSNVRTSSLKIAELEIERAQHLSALNTGLYVEKAHVTAELTRLMERATSEAAARGQAESARHNIEQELDDLSASLFDQANTMVAEARLGQAQSERKVVDAEMALKSAEEAVSMMQLQMQAIRDEKDRAVDEITMMKTRMEKGKFIENQISNTPAPIRLSNLYTPYHEFLMFITHLRTVRPSSIHPPHISALLQLPFLTRIQVEDSDPTIRLDFAPSLNWLSRRSVLSAIHSGQLTIEPMSISALLLESSGSLQSIIPGSQTNVSCALCGTHIFPPKNANNAPPSHPLSSLPFTKHTNSSTWSTSLFKNPLAAAAPSPPPTPTQSNTPSSVPASPAGTTTIYVFRVVTNHPNNSPYAAQSNTTNQNQNQRPTSYPLCSSGWCLTRLRSTCSLWAFVRAGIVDRVWEEELSAVALHPVPSISSASVYSQTSTVAAPITPPKSQTEKELAPPVPPRRRSKMSSVGALWGMASGALRSTPSSPSQKEKETSVSSSDEPSKADSPKTGNDKPLSVAVPPPLPRRNVDRRLLSASSDDKRSVDIDLHLNGGSKSPEAETSGEKTPIVQSGGVGGAIGAPSEKMTISISRSSSALSGMGDEFTTPVEEINALPLSNVSASESKTESTAPAPQSPTPHSVPSSPKSIASPKPRSTKRHSASPTPRSPRSVPLPDSRPGTPIRGFGHAHKRSLSGSIAPLNIDANSKAPSRAGSPVPSMAGSISASTISTLTVGHVPPPLPRRAAARRAVPVPPVPTLPSPVPVSTPATSGDKDELVKEEEKEEAKALDRSKNRSSSRSRTSDRNRSRSHSRSPTESDRKSKRESGLAAAPPPPLPPRRVDHVAAKPSVSEYSISESESGNDGLAHKLRLSQEEGRGEEDVRMDEIQDRDKASVDEKEKDTKEVEKEKEKEENVIGDSSWEERTWKEIVRLKEDMFWARVGGIRV